MFMHPVYYITHLLLEHNVYASCVLYYLSAIGT